MIETYLLPCLYAFLACLAFCFIVNVRGRMLFFAPLGSSLGWLVYLLCGLAAEDLVCYFFATVAVSAYAEIMARVHRAPATGFSAGRALPDGARRRHLLHDGVLHQRRHRDVP